MEIAAKIVIGLVVGTLIGMTGLGLLDFQTTALGERIPGVEVHAQILEQIFDGEYLHRPSGATWIEAGLLAPTGSLLRHAVPRTSIGADRPPGSPNTLVYRPMLR